MGVVGFAALLANVGVAWMLFRFDITAGAGPGR